MHRPACYHLDTPVRYRSTASPALSDASTADGEASPVLPPLQAPRLPDRILGLLRTPPDTPAEPEDDDNSNYSGNRWGSPYPPDLRGESSSSSENESSEASEDSPIHRLELPTPFLRPAPPTQDVQQPEVRLPGISAAATVLANRARRIAHGITEGWIRQHTAHSTEQEKRHWFSDGESESSSLSDSYSGGEEAAWLGSDEVRTPKASRKKNSGRSRQPSRGRLAKQSSNDTLRQSHLSRETGNIASRMASSERASDNASNATIVAEPTRGMARPSTPTMGRSISSNWAAEAHRPGPLTPTRGAVKRAQSGTTPRIKKKVPWKGKSVMVLLPKDDERGLPGRAPVPLTEADTTGMLRSWQQLGYNIDGFDLHESNDVVTPMAKSQSRSDWPNPDDLVAERRQRAWNVLLPDLNAWKKYVDELNEAKLRALGVSFGDDEPPAPSVSPGSTTSRQASMAPYPPLPFSPPSPVRASPRLQNLREVDEEAVADGPSKGPAQRFVHHNPNDNLQREIDEAEYHMEAEYHLEEQMRSQLDNDEDYSPHNDNDKSEVALGHGGDQMVQFAPQPPRFAGDANGLVLHHPRPHSRGHSLSQKYFTEDDASTQGAFRPALQQINSPPAEDNDIETNPSNLGTPIQALEFSKLVHQRGFSTASNPWLDNDSGKSADGAHQAHLSHGSKSSFSKLNVEAAEFKFNPTSTFNPGAFAFSNDSFQPTAFKPEPTGLPLANSSKINAKAPVFSPGQSDFSFPASGPKFRPDAPAFTPTSVPTSVTSPIMSGAESGSNRDSSIFGNIDLSGTDILQPAKPSKAVPIVRPESPPAREDQEDTDGRPVADDSRVKRTRATADDDDTVPLFAEPAKDDTPVPETQLEQAPIHEDLTAEEKSFDESHLTTMSSTMVSETTDTKATVSPSEPSPDQSTLNWTPFEFKNTVEVQSFNDARPFGTDVFQPMHKKSLSANAMTFVSGSNVWGAPSAASEGAAKEESEEIVQPEADMDTDAVTEDDLEEQVEEAREEAVESVEKHVEEEEPIAAATSPPAHASKGLADSRYAAPASPQAPKRTGLAASRFAAPPSTAEDDEPPVAQPVDHTSTVADDEHASGPLPAEASMDDIDEIIRHLNENPDMAVNRTYEEQSDWRETNSSRHSSVPDSPSHLPPPSYSRSAAPSPSHAGYEHPADLDDPFTDPPRSAQFFEGAVQRLNGSESVPVSDWEGVFSEDEQTKLESRVAFFDGRVAFFDGRVNELVGALLAARMGPLERSLNSINHALVGISRQSPPSRLERGSVSAEVRDSDADDEDDEVPPGLLRSMSPRRDRRMEQIRAAVLDAFATQRRSQSKESSRPSTAKESLVLEGLEELKVLFMQSLQSAFSAKEIKSVVEEVVERRIPPPQPVDNEEQMNELQARVAELEQRLRAEGTKAEAEVAARRAAENRVVEIDRELQSASTRIEVEMMNKTALNQRIADLEERAQHTEQLSEQEVKTRRAAEDRLSEIQRLLRISSEEETRLRELVDEKDQTIKTVESAQSKSVMRLTLLEAGQARAHQAQSEAQNKLNALEADAREARKEALHWRSETDRIVAIIQRRDKDLAQAIDENKALHKLIDTLGTQLQENERVRDTWRGKFIVMQEEMAHAAREITEENARHTKKEQALLARQEVLEARLQAEARTRERIETELERLEMGERQGMRAVSECKRLEGVLAEMRTENHKLHQSAMRYQAEFQEARESAAREVQRTRDSLQAEVDNANHEVNVVREDLEDHISRLRSQLDQVKLDADTANSRHDMLLEEAQNSKQVELDELARKHQNEIEDLQEQYERKLGNTTEDAQRAEQNLLERLSISNSKSEYLQDKVAHLEEKLEIAKEAARAAAHAAKSSAGHEAGAALPQPALARQLSLPEKISPQALRESIMVLQEQLQEREQRIEDLEAKLAKADPEAETKISKRDDEIIWLRELLAVRHSDLQDIISALARDNYDKHAVKDAAIRLKANLQMEEQERERAMNGGSAINLPNIAATIRDAATPRVAQAVGPFAAAWGNWRKTRDLLSSQPPPKPATAPPLPPESCPFRIKPLLGGLLTPPASAAAQTPATQPKQQQPTAFSSTGRRFTAQDLANRPRPPPPTASLSAPLLENVMPYSSNQTGQEEAPSTPKRRIIGGPVTPPMMRLGEYDEDAHSRGVDEFDDDGGFFEDDD
ncbi:hypothetical protein N0V88_003601 [Collariella sp. IMI 366227]|nr:hypothetical protein N0V88_003601 [Collariella sp. IMI 366227]